jgi:hypothetical protein
LCWTEIAPESICLASSVPSSTSLVWIRQVGEQNYLSQQIEKCAASSHCRVDRLHALHVEPGDLAPADILRCARGRRMIAANGRCVMPLSYVTYGAQVVDNLRNNTRIPATDRVNLAKAICSRVDKIGQAKSIAKVLTSPAQFDELLKWMSITKLVELAQLGAVRFSDELFTLRLARLSEVDASIGYNIVSFLPSELRAQVNQASRQSVNMIRTGGVSDDLASHLRKTPERLAYGYDAPCIVCKHREPHLPMLRESPQTRAVASLLVERIHAAHFIRRKVLRSGGDGFRGYMLGVLKLGGRVFIAISGSVLPAELAAVIQESGYGTFVHSVPPHTTAGGALIDEVYMARSDGRSPAEPFMCAAPKLIAEARAYLTRGQNWSMTEMWCGPPTESREEGHAYWSCSNCIDILPMMLCLRKPVALMRGGYKLVVSKQGKKEASAGRNPVRK